MNTPASGLSHPKYRPDIDGLRAVAVLSVVIFHAFPEWMSGGFIGVDVFFVISGFLISTILLENLATGTFSFAEFYARRIRRIFPALLVVLVACLVVGWFVLVADELNQLGKHTAAGAGFVSNLVLWSEAGYFDNSAETKPLLHLWSLGIEEQFYIVWPLLLWLAWKWQVAGGVLGLSFLLVAASFSLNAVTVFEDPVAAFYSPLTRFWELLCGGVLAWFVLRRGGVAVPAGSATQAAVPGIGRLADGAAIFGLALLGAGFWGLSKESSFPGYWALMPVLGAVLIIAAGPDAWLNRRVLSHRVLVWFGLVSFPLYLWHWPILSFGKIVYFDTPPPEFRVVAVLAAILLAWATVEFVEKPFRFGGRGVVPKVAVLSFAMFCVAAIGLVLARADLSQTHTFENRVLERDDEHAIGASLAWYRGKEDWLFLGNAYNDTVAKLKLTTVPGDEEVLATRDKFFRLAAAAAKYGIPVVLIVGPDKSTIYPEYLPEEVQPSPVRHIDFFLDALRDVPNLVIHDPSAELLALKATEGLLYWKTDTHWNNKGAFLAYQGFARLLGVPVPDVDFKRGDAHAGDLIGISRLQDFPLGTEDSWDVVWKQGAAWREREIPDKKRTNFGAPAVATNDSPLSGKRAWVVGDSFAVLLRQYFNATFAEVRYVGHWREQMDELPGDLAGSGQRPDVIVVVRVERSF